MRGADQRAAAQGDAPCGALHRLSAQGGGSLRPEADARLRLRRAGFWAAAVAGAILDLVSKELAFADYAIAAPGGLSIISGWLHLELHCNPGTIWGLLPGRTIALIAIVSLIIPSLVLMAYSCRAPGAPLWALGLVLGGAVGNLYDRVTGEAVRDFIVVDLGFPPANPWPVFNLADAFITAGVLVFIAWSLLIAAPEPDGGGGADSAAGQTRDRRSDRP